jgi:Rab GDP dissociation inhibitor
VDLRAVSARAFFDKFGLDASTIDFVGHAMALQPDESYLDRPALETVEAIKLYAGSLERYGKSPFIYPVYGLGGLPESFSR